MRSFLFYILLLCIRLISSKLINYNGVSLTTELIPHIEENKLLNFSRNHVFGFDRPSNNGHDPEGQTGGPINNYKASKQGFDSKNGLTRDFSTKIERKRTCMVCPFRTSSSVKKALKHSFKALKLFLVPSHFPKSAIKSLYITTGGSMIVTLILGAVGLSDYMFNVLRSNWAFQGEMLHGNVETYTRLGMLVMSADLVFRVVFLRLNLLNNLVDSTFLEKVNWMGTNLGGSDSNKLKKIFSGLTNGLVLTKMVLLTLLHYLFMETNWNTGSFMMEREISRPVTQFALVFLLLGLFENVVDSITSPSFNKLTDIEHLVEPFRFRSSELKRELNNELMDAFHRLPKFLQALVNKKSRLLLKLRNLNEGFKLVYSPDMETLFLMLNIAMATYSNSAAGMYLVFWQYLASIVVNVLSNVEKSVLTRKVPKINFDLLNSWRLMKVKNYFFTTHFWGPVANWGFVLAGISEMSKNPERISPRMTGVLCIYSILFMRFALVVKPRNLLLFSCHFCNSSVQAYNYYRYYSFQKSKKLQPIAA